MAFYGEKISKAKTPLELREALDKELFAWYDVDMGGLYITPDTLGTAVAVALIIRAKHINLNLPEVPSDIAGLINWCINSEKIMTGLGNKRRGEEIVTEKKETETTKDEANRNEAREKKMKIREEHKDFLRKIAMEVTGLVLKKENKSYFRKQMEAFCKKSKGHEDELEKIKNEYEANTELKYAAEKLEKRIKNSPEVIAFNKGQGMTEGECQLECTGGWGMLENFKDYIKYKDFWGPPTQTVNLVYYLTYFPNFEHTDFERKPNETEILICHYTLLTAIHDNFVKEKPIFFDEPDECYYNTTPQHWIVKVIARYDCHNDIFRGSFDSVKDTQDWITRALSYVKADLARIEPTEKKPKAKRRGRPKKYTDDILEAGCKTYEQSYERTKDSKGAWSEELKRGEMGEDKEFENNNPHKEDFYKFLTETANEIYKTVSKKQNHEQFQNMIKIFCKKNEDFENEYNQLEETAEKNPELYDYESWKIRIDTKTGKETITTPLMHEMKNPPTGYEGYVWYDGFWGKPTKTPNLMEYLHNPLCRDFLIYWNQDNVTKVNEKEILICSYALLVSIHDTLVSEKPIYTKNLYNGNWRNSTSWIRLLWDDYTHEDNFQIVESYFTFYEFTAWIKRAFEDVKADLDKIGLAETEHAEQKQEDEIKPKEIEIDLKSFNKSGSKELLKDLILTRRVNIDEDKYGGQQPKRLRKVLHDNDYDEVAQHIHIKDKEIYINEKEITLKAKK